MLFVLDDDDDDDDDDFHSLMMMFGLMLVWCFAVRIFSSYIRFWYQFDIRLKNLCLPCVNGKGCF